MADSKIPGVSPVTLIPGSLGSGGDASVIVDGIKPPGLSSDAATQYDSYSGGAPNVEDYVGVEFPKVYTIRRVVFQAGIKFGDGGWFDTIKPQVRQNDVWNDVSGVLVSPPYTGPAFNNFDIFEFLFSPFQGDAVRLIGQPGGSAFFVSCGEFEAYGTLYVPAVVLSPGVSYQEPPYSGPYNPLYYKNPPYATQDNPRNDEVRWCMVCNRPVVVDDRPGFRHRHFRDEDSVEVGE